MNCDETTIAIAVSLVVCILATLVLRRSRPNDNDKAPPEATGRVWLLGHALQYKKDPPGFLLQQEKKVGKIFQINLCGRRMIVIGSDSKAMRQVASMPESIVSSRKAVAEIGFEYTLGTTNVYKGTDWHKRILRDAVLNPSKFESSFLPRLYVSLTKALKHEAMRYPHNNDDSGVSVYSVFHLFTLVRRCILRTCLDCLISPDLLSACPNNGASLLNALMDFQNQVEDATAKAAILPRYLSVPLVLKPVAETRKQLTLQLASLLKPLLQNDNKGDGDSMGPWLQIFRDDQVAPLEAAELLLGLLFAAHKNPAIGAAQAYCFLQQSNSDEWKVAQQEAAKLLETFESSSNNSNNLVQSLLQAKTLRACVLETMRLTAHTIGAIRLVQEPFDLETESGKVYHISQGETLAISHITSHLSWGEDAAEFKLNRSEWRDANNKNNDMSCPVDAYKLTTFSHGLHKCPGERVAMAMMELMLALLLVHKTELARPSLPKVSFERATLAQRNGPVPVTITIE